MSTEDPKSGRAKRPASPAVQPQRSTRAAGNPRADYCRTTRDVQVSVRSFFLADQSQPDENHFVWAYRVKIENQGTEPVQLLRRTWQITDARGRTQHVHGAGVVGEQPLLEPGESFEYTSGTPLDTPSGFMVGAYHMLIPSSGENFDVAIPAFSLDSPHQSGRVH
jgi:ApaG protein